MANKQLKILALEAYYGGSHRAFLDAWIARSQHQWEVLSLPPFKWKWRMRHSSVTFANQLASIAPPEYDCMFCSDMTNLAEFQGLAPTAFGQLPALLYFHENQLTYPDVEKQVRDHHYAYTNFVSALTADAVWFNSEYHRGVFLASLESFLCRMPDHQETTSVEAIRAKSQVHSPGVDLSVGNLSDRLVGPLHIVWAARWETDKNPEDFFAAMIALDKSEIDFCLSVLGESFQRVPAIFDEARKKLSHRIRRWGFQATRSEYQSCLQSADVIVSTANHEFFGIAVVEAIAAGAIPILPNRLSYPEILANASDTTKDSCLYDGTVANLQEKLSDISDRLPEKAWRDTIRTDLAASIGKFDIASRVAEMDDALIHLVQEHETT